MQLAFDIVTYASSGLVSYYVALFAVSLWTTRRTPGAAQELLTFVIVVPAHNEELVIAETVDRIRGLEGERFLALIMDDGSNDRTAAVARRAAAGDPRIAMIRRPKAISGRGKGEVLNHAYALISELSEKGDPRLHGARPDQVVMCVVDADGWMEPHALRAVAPYYADPRVAGVQLPVRMWNGRDGFLALMQDLEFTGFCLFVQAGRDPFGSVGLGGNGQFIRLSALQTLGARPWTTCLTEDLDVGLSLVEHGWRNRFCPGARVSQQAVRKFRPFFRQRTRWIQGHYSCWRHLPTIWFRRGIPLQTRLDLSLYLLLVAFVLILAAQFGLGMASLFGLVAVQTAPLSFIHDAQLYRAATLALSCGPLLAFAVTYQRFATRPIPWWSTPGVFFLFAFYGFFWGVPTSVRALARIALRRDSWTKTPRTAPDAATMEVESATVEIPQERNRVGARAGRARQPSGSASSPLRQLLHQIVEAEARARQAQERALDAEARLAAAAALVGARK